MVTLPLAGQADHHLSVLLLLLPSHKLQQVCCSTCGGTTELQDKLRSEEAERTLTGVFIKPGSAIQCYTVLSVYSSMFS
jgi:hypothetical protein